MLTQLIGFEKSDNERLTLPDQVDIDTLIQFNNFLQHIYTQSHLNDRSLSSHGMKMVDHKSFCPCNHCTYNNPINPNTCKICPLPRNVCEINVIICFMALIVIYVLFA